METETVPHETSKERGGELSWRLDKGLVESDPLSYESASILQQSVSYRRSQLNVSYRIRIQREYIVKGRPLKFGGVRYC